MYIKKSVLITCSIILILVTAIVAIGAVNPFGFTHFGELIKFGYVSRLIDENYYEDVDSKTYMNTALQGMAAATGDAYTGYLWGDYAQEYMEDMTGNYVGVGLYIENHLEDDTVTIVSAIPGTPAEEAGLATDDKILKIDGVNYTGMQLNEASAAMKGIAGTQVVLTVQKADTGEIKELTLIRRQVDVQYVTAGMLTGNVGKIQITQFTEKVSQQFAAALQDLKTQGMTALVLDLRNNPGGIVDEAVAIADQFIDQKTTIVYTQDKYGHKTNYDASGKGTKFPMVILTNGGSASASEILAGALKDLDLATLVGEKTYGKGIVQSVYDIEGDILSVTSAKYYLPNGECIHQQGIEPNITLPMEAEKYARLSTLPMDQDIQVQKALEILTKS